MGEVVVEDAPVSEAQRLIIEIVKAADLPFPVRVTDTVRNEPGSYHDRSKGPLAVDLAVGYSPSTTTSKQMREVARVFDRYGGLVTQLIHTTPFDDDNGYYISDGRRVSGGYYGEPTSSPNGHHTHVHVALTPANAKKILNQIKPPTPVEDIDNMSSEAELKKLMNTLVTSTDSTLVHLLQQVDAEQQRTNELLVQLNQKLGSGTPVTYTVKPGDTLTRIALNFNTTVSELVRLNNLTNPDAIAVGQELRVK